MNLWSGVREQLDTSLGDNVAAFHIGEMRSMLADADALLVMVSEPYLPTFDEVMARYEERDGLDEFTVGMVVAAVRKLIRKNALTALPEHLRAEENDKPERLKYEAISAQMPWDQP